jgi:hypothetical protein
MKGKMTADMSYMFRKKDQKPLRVRGVIFLKLNLELPSDE